MTDVNITIGTGGTYTTIAAADAANFGATGTDFVTNTEHVFAALKSQSFNEQLKIDGLTCDATWHLTIKADTGAEYDHVADTGAKIFRSGSFTCDLQTSGFVDFFDVGIGSLTQDVPIFRRGNNALTSVNRCTVYTSGSVLEQVNYTGGVFNASVVRTANNSNTSDFRYVDAYHCTFIADASTVITFVRSADCDNCVAHSNDVTYTSIFWTDCTGDNNAATDTSAPGASAVDNIVDADFNAFSSNDFTLSGTGSALYHAGTPISVTLDNDSVTYHATTPSIGAYEFVSGGGGPTITAGTLSLMGVGI